ncbi:MAG: cytochrome-c oxidase, cbb3-type subunit III [Gammaproteobacteria bacterium]|nr:cytochrome-c oxidase, cbb3-type subunit III [Gammaproteobacteria bacterium]
MSGILSAYIAFIVALNIIGAFLLIQFTRRIKVGDESHSYKDGELIAGHDVDGIQEMNNPLPRWWLWKFYILIAFGVGYLVMYPGFGSFKGVLNWSSAGQHAQEEEAARAEFGPLFQKWSATPVAELAKDEEAVKAGQRIFLANCATCHGSDAGGNIGFPNLTDNDWLWGGDADTVKTTIHGGRKGNMPAWGKVIGEQGVIEVKNYVLSLSGRKHDADAARAGKKIFATTCVACHGPEGKGMPAMGAPNLTDNTWLFGGTPRAIEETIRNGRAGVMPTWGPILGEEKVHVVAAYVFSLRNQAAQ